MTILKNPLSSPVAIKYLGNEYELLAGEAKALSEEVAAFWLRTHKFLDVVLEEAKPEAPVESSVAVEPAPEAPVEVPVIDEVPEAPEPVVSNEESPSTVGEAA